MPQEHQSTENATGLTESPCAHDTPSSTPRFALWLAPPPEAAAELSHTIQQAAAEVGGPCFYPHVTLLGAVEMPQEEAIKILQSMRGAGAVAVQFTGDVVAARDERSGIVPWSQSAAALVSESCELLSLLRLSRRLFMGVPECEPISWASPLRQPHLSLAYVDGSKAGLCAFLKPPRDFVATEVEL
uniref:2',3'-cyclic-nucleotide 3'-phosphodiesterase n=1 Tax=Chrysotila carterae TaxID=13221 RepID=A0A7S4C5K5_CHRCT